jgi:LysR family glycine cleavage system transcriptional activator
MTDRLPPLNALRAFESAARHLSFRKAAAELHVTPAAISHQVRALEDQLGATLFRRLTRAVELTATGRLLLPGLGAGFEALARAVEAVRDHQNAGTLTVNVPPSFATQWLMPRLHRFATAHPAIDVRISASMRLIDPRRAAVRHGVYGENELVGDADIEIHFGLGNYPNAHVDKLFGVTFTPLCSPRLMQGAHPLTNPADLRHHLLLHDDMHDIAEGWPGWKEWLAATGADAVEAVDATSGHSFSHPLLGLEAAVDGMGVVLGARELAARDLATGRLVAPFALNLDLGSGYFLVGAMGSAERPKIAAFRHWLLQEASQIPPG